MRAPVVVKHNPFADAYSSDHFEGAAPRSGHESEGPDVAKVLRWRRARSERMLRDAGEVILDRAQDAREASTLRIEQALTNPMLTNEIRCRVLR